MYWLKFKNKNKGNWQNLYSKKEIRWNDFPNDITWGDLVAKTWEDLEGHIFKKQGGC